MMDDIQAQKLKNRIVKPSVAKYGFLSAESRSARRIAEATLRIISSRPSEPLPQEVIDQIHEGWRTRHRIAVRYGLSYAEMEIEGLYIYWNFFEYLCPLNEPLPSWVGIDLFGEFWPENAR